MNRRYRDFAALAALLLLSALPARAQTPDSAAARAAAEAQMGGNPTQQEIIDRLRASGMNRAEVRSRLQMMGQDPNLADPYFDALEGTGSADPANDAAFLAALRAMSAEPEAVTDSLGLTPQAERFLDQALLEAELRFRSDSIYRARRERMDSIALAEAGITTSGLPLFGRELFARTSTEFSPMLTGPVNENYVLGPGDEINLVLTGDVERAATVIVNRQGYLILPDVGQIPVAGMTVGELENVLYSRLGEVFSGVRRDADATTHFQVSVGELRTNQVYIVGEAEVPGAYTVSSLATVFNALYQAGGPTVNGSFRAVEVRRGGRTVATVDVYEYLQAGVTARDVRLEHGDMVFIPLAGARASVLGQVRRPAIYELKPGEDLQTLLAFAGGFRAQAVAERVQVTRILPPEQRTPGIDRVVIDVSLEELLSGRSVPVYDGDVVQVFAVNEEQRHFVYLLGEVNRPGTYEWRPGLTAGQVLANAEGLDPAAYRARAHIFRLNESDGSRSLLPISLEDPTTNVPLADRDSIIVYSQTDMRLPATVTVQGFVKVPGTYRLAEGMSLRDLVLTAGGFLEGAYRLEAEIARRPDPATRTDTTALLSRVPLTDAGVPGSDPEAQALPAWRPEPGEVILQPGDQVFVRRAPGYAAPRVVVVTGEVMFPGAYVLESRAERLLTLVQRAGGLTSEAHAAGMRLLREGSLVGTDLQTALDRPGSRFNVLLEAGDSIHVPTFDPTVLITGAVAFETRALFEEGRDLDYYISQAGGYLDEADKSRVSVTYANGQREVADRVLFWRNMPEVLPGSSIAVPAERPGEEFDWDQFLTRALAIASTTVTIMLAVDRL